MVRFLKKFWKPSKNPVSPEDPTHQTSPGIDVKRVEASEGENRLRGMEILGLIRLAGLILLWQQIQTTERNLGSRIKAER